MKKSLLIALLALSSPNALAALPPQTPEIIAINQRADAYEKWASNKGDALRHSGNKLDIFEAMGYLGASVMMMNVKGGLQLGRLQPNQATWVLDNFQQMAADGTLSEADMQKLNAISKQLPK